MGDAPCEAAMRAAAGARGQSDAFIVCSRQGQVTGVVDGCLPWAVVGRCLGLYSDVSCGVLRQSHLFNRLFIRAARATTVSNEKKV
jgi:hypothetical protein